ncbi:hypothetical protein C8Q80DRAFT_15175 [Daedaleopsis nitida]|nr:hypothetical protein C8Q80DRAFT_15175 [Daedaleopsis nitida]
MPPSSKDWHARLVRKIQTAPMSGMVILALPPHLLSQSSEKSSSRAVRDYRKHQKRFPLPPSPLGRTSITFSPAEDGGFSFVDCVETPPAAAAARRVCGFAPGRTGHRRIQCVRRPPPEVNVISESCNKTRRKEVLTDTLKLHGVLRGIPPSERTKTIAELASKTEKLVEEDPHCSEQDVWMAAICLQLEAIMRELDNWY